MRLFDAVEYQLRMGRVEGAGIEALRADLRRSATLATPTRSPLFSGATMEAAARTPEADMNEVT